MVGALLRRGADAGYYAILLVGALIAVVPFLWMLSTSFKSASQAFTYPPQWIPNPFELAGYVRALAVVDGRIFLNSIAFSIAVVVLQGFLATCGGFGFSRLHFPFKNQLFVLYMGTMMIPPQITMIPTYIEVVALGWNNGYLGLIVPVLAQGAFGTFLFRQFFMTLPGEMYDAAELDGARVWTQFWRLTLPLSRPALTAYGIISFLTAWNMYLWPLIVVHSSDMSVIPIAVAQLSTSSTADPTSVMAASTLSVLPILAVFVLGQRWFVQGIAMTGMRG